ncbi:hypothetical protein TTHERM_00780600 (macronuclear) [Tetrahymena thermophila SB210]|uniref:Uncharacterized protein n=1 Tax=Tetrahymena thermophila (strain SB210) TaxID=312017 RepID=I7LXR2_TETTS|nr:hypothetical protein TTHERM_00780600 [Tetrahymena thermophila SB210]EAS05971.3 hypothetical protein TTHERM_00780600 [Tetrahymena thermophila SB210]|eukprot:XP_001026216.3 hypothetical protein TTHERM_00780600 [Tetrahymena thermophila SB210]
MSKKQQADILQPKKVTNLKDLMNVGYFEYAQKGDSIYTLVPYVTNKQLHNYTKILEKNKDPQNVSEQKQKIKNDIKREIENLRKEIGGCYDVLKNLGSFQVVKTERFDLPDNIKAKDVITSMLIRKQEISVTRKMFQDGLQSIRECLEQQENTIKQQQKYKQSFYISQSSQVSSYKPFPYKKIDNQIYINFYNIPIFNDNQIAPLNISPYLLFIPLQYKNDQITAKLADVYRTTPDIFEKQLIIKVVKNNTLGQDPEKLGPTIQQISFLFKPQLSEEDGDEDDESQIQKIYQLRYRVYERVIFNKLINICNKFVPKQLYIYDTSVYPNLSIFIDDSYTLKFELKKLSQEEKRFYDKKNSYMSRKQQEENIANQISYSTTRSPYTLNLYSNLFNYMTKMPSHRSLIKYIIEIKITIAQKLFLYQPRFQINVIRNQNEEVVYIGAHINRTSSKSNQEQQYDTQLKITPFTTEFQQLNKLSYTFSNSLSEIPRFCKEMLFVSDTGIISQRNQLRNWELAQMNLQQQMMPAQTPQ